MFNPTILDQITQRLTDNVPAGLQQLKGDLTHNLRANLEQILRDMQLVSREEFDIQQAVLQRTRARLTQLETRVATLEAAAQQAPSSIEKT